MSLLVFALSILGIYCILSSHWPSVYAPAAATLKKRAPRQLTQTEVAISTIAQRIQPFIDIDPIKKMRLAETLKNLGHQVSPEAFQAQAIARGMIYGCAGLAVVVLSPSLCILLFAGIFWAVYSNAQKKLQKEVAERRQRIERELPQLASTIRQSLNSTCDVVSILSSYRKVCGPVLKDEIDRTLNDMVTGNQERAIRALESRVASPKLGQLTRGLISVLRGDDQRLYFDMLASEFRKEQNEEIAKALQERPAQLTPYMGALFVCLVLMICASLGTYLTQQIGIFFN